MKDGAFHHGELYLNGVYFADISTVYNWRTICLGSFAVGERVELSLRIEPEAGGVLSDTPLLYYENNAVITAYCDAIKARETSCVSDKDGHMSISLKSEKPGVLLCTVPTDACWKVSLDGERVRFEPAFGVFMAVATDAGEHTLEMSFRPAGLTAGICIFACSLFAVAVWALIRKKRGKG